MPGVSISLTVSEGALDRFFAFYVQTGRERAALINHAFRVGGPLIDRLISDFFEERDREKAARTARAEAYAREAAADAAKAEATE